MSITVEENMANARRIRDERKGQVKAYLAALEAFHEVASASAMPPEIASASAQVVAARAMIGGGK